MLSRGTDEFYGEAAYAGLIRIATFCYAISVNTIRNYLTGIHPLGVTSVSFFFFGVPLSIYLLFRFNCSNTSSWLFIFGIHCIACRLWYCHCGYTF